MARRIMNRKELRANYEAAERRKGETDEVEEEEEGEEEEAEDEDEEEAEEEGEGEDEAGDEDDEEVEKPVKKKKAVKAPKAPKAKPRARAAKVVRMKVVWGVFNNSNQRIATYDYVKKAEAEAHAAKLMTDKKSTHFVQPIKEPIEEKKE